MLVCTCFTRGGWADHSRRAIACTLGVFQHTTLGVLLHEYAAGKDAPTSTAARLPEMFPVSHSCPSFTPLLLLASSCSRARFLLSCPLPAPPCGCVGTCEDEGRCTHSLICTYSQL